MLPPCHSAPGPAAPSLRPPQSPAGHAADSHPAAKSVPQGPGGVAGRPGKHWGVAPRQKPTPLPGSACADSWAHV